MSKPKNGKYADVSFIELLHAMTIVIRLPVVALWALLTSIAQGRQLKEIKRSVGIGLIRWLFDTCSVAQVQFLFPSSLQTYKLWAYFNNMPVVMEELVDDGVLCWVGPKRTDKVVLYVPGGALYWPLLLPLVDFCRHVQLELAKKDCNVGFAILAYSLIPTATFPTQLNQATAAVSHMLALGVHPSNLHLAGDSAGGQIILSLLSNILHPLPDTRSITPPLIAPIRGVYLMSPWVCLRSQTASFLANPRREVFSTKTAQAFGKRVITPDTPQQHIPYIEALSAPGKWFSDLASVVDRVLITAGGTELFRDDIVQISQTLREQNPKLELTSVVQEGGVHDDPLIDFLARLPPEQSGSLTPLVVHWLAAGLNPDQYHIPDYR